MVEGADATTAWLCSAVAWPDSFINFSDVRFIGRIPAGLSSSRRRKGDLKTASNPLCHAELILADGASHLCVQRPSGTNLLGGRTGVRSARKPRPPGFH